MTLKLEIKPGNEYKLSQKLLKNHVIISLKFNLESNLEIKQKPKNMP